MRHRSFVFGSALAILALGGCAMEERDHVGAGATQDDIGVTGTRIEPGRVYGAPPGPTPGASAVENGVRGGTGAPGGGEPSEKLGPPLATDPMTPQAPTERAPAQGAPADEGAHRDGMPHGEHDATGAPGLGGASGVFQRLDANDDGVISRAEAGVDPRTSEIFQQADRDNNGALDPSEFRSVHQ